MKSFVDISENSYWLIKLKIKGKLFITSLNLELALTKFKTMKKRGAVSLYVRIALKPNTPARTAKNEERLKMDH